MNHLDPNKADANGLPEIALHYHPLIGAYDSNDPHALECHLQLMKLAGIHGVIIDWYGTEQWMENNWLGGPLYAKINGKPLLMVLAHSISKKSNGQSYGRT